MERKLTRRENYRMINGRKEELCSKADKYGIKPTADKEGLTANDIQLAYFFSRRLDKIAPSTLKSFLKVRYDVLDDEVRKRDTKNENGIKFKEIISDPSFEDFDIVVFEKNGKPEYVVPKSKIGYVDGQSFAKTGVNSIHWDKFLALSKKFQEEKKQFKPFVVQSVNESIKNYLK